MIMIMIMKFLLPLSVSSMKILPSHLREWNDFDAILVLTVAALLFISVSFNFISQIEFLVNKLLAFSQLDLMD